MPQLGALDLVSVVILANPLLLHTVHRYKNPYGFISVVLSSAKVCAETEVSLL